MKKLVIIMSVYLVIIFAACIGLSEFIIKPPVLIAGTERGYKFLRGLKWFLSILPALCLSGFTISCSVIWSKKDYKVSVRFSPLMVKYFKLILIASLVFVFILTFNAEVFVPAVRFRSDEMKAAPQELERYIATTNTLLENNEPLLALRQAKLAHSLAPENEEVNALYKKVTDLVELEHDRQRFLHEDDVKKVSKPIHEKDRSYTVLQLLAMSKKAAEEKKWFEAHYWAYLAKEGCDGTNTNLTEATRIANEAWSKLNLPVEFDNSAEREYYLTKKKGYDALNRGDSLKSYYIFMSLKKNTEFANKDPDIEKFFALAEEDVKNQYFFIDETENMDDLAQTRNVYFNIRNNDGTNDVFYINSAMDVKKRSGLVRYLEGFNVSHYAANGNFEYSFSVPYAKVVALPVSEFTADARELLGIKKSWKYVPFIMLRSVDRETEGVISVPQVELKEGILSLTILRENNLKQLYLDEEKAPETMPISYDSFMFLPMPYSDFETINRISVGAENMSLMELKKFIPSAKKYGFSKEVFTENLVQRGTFPILILALFIFCAAMGWNYRIEEEKTMFKFRWILLFPLYGIIFILSYDMCMYFFNIINYSMVGLLGSSSLFVGPFFYIVLFIVSSMVFMSRRS